MIGAIFFGCQAKISYGRVGTPMLHKKVELIHDSCSLMFVHFHLSQIMFINRVIPKINHPQN